jgi:putative SOS response-associated peptidase YedK
MRVDGMCGRFVQRHTWDDIQDLYDLPEGPARNLQAHYNVAPTEPVNIVKLATSGATELVSMRWGLVPWWWKEPLKQLPASFNARAETVADKPHVPGFVPTASVHHSGKRLLRVAQNA